MPNPDGSVVHDVDDDQDDSELPAALPVGFVIGGKYQVKRVLGIGGNGAVYEGEHTDIGHRVAIKVAHHKLDDRGDIMVRFRREAKICGSLRHPHVGQVFDVGTLEDGAPYMVMELQEGRSLADVIDETRLPVAAIIDITRQLLAGLGAAHQAGAVHLDVKPDNVMLVRDHGGDLVVKLVDFGISKRLSEQDSERTENEEGFIIGSPDYMPPEQLLGEAVDTRTDIYATGALLYEVITGRTPFDGATTEALVESVLRDAIAAPTTLRPECPVELERVVLKALQRQPADRYQSADELSRALAEVRAAARAAPPTSLVQLSERPTARPPIAKSVRRRRTIDAHTLQTLRIRTPAAAAKARPRAPQQAPYVPAAAKHQSRALRLGAGVAAALACALVLAWFLSSREADSAAAVTTVTLASAAAPGPQVPAAAVVPPLASAVLAVNPAPSAAAPVEHEATTTAPATQRTTPARSRAPSSRSGRTLQPSEKANTASAKSALAVEPTPAPQVPQQDIQLTRAQLKVASTAFVRGQIAQALTMYRELVKVAPREPNAWRGLAVTANRSGERSEAERALRRYLQLRPGAKDAASILQKVGNTP